MAFDFLKKITGKTKKVAGDVFRLVFPHSIDEASVAYVEKTLIAADFGINITQEIIAELRLALRNHKSLQRESVEAIAISILKKNLEGAEGNCWLNQHYPQVICLIGANGSGKTTTAAKLANFYKMAGKRVILGACDTFRAAANEQLSLWGEALSVDVVRSHHGADAAAVAFDAYKAAIARDKDILILDTAGRLHVKSDLMAELQKIFRVLKKANEQLVLNVWLVVDGTIGINTHESAKIFHEMVGLNGIIVTKLDGSSVGGALVGIYKNLHVPILFIGTGETLDSLQPFSIESYIGRLFDGNSKIT